MSLASPHTFTAGELLTAANLQNIETNILNNPISLISPTTGVINFNLQSHTNLLPSALTGTSGSTGNVALISTSGTVIWSNMPTSGIAVGTGSTGQVLAVTSSNTAPSFQVIPPDGGLSTTVPSTGMLYYISTGGKLLGLALGTVGHVLTVSSSQPAWAAAPSAAAFDPESNVSFIEDFIGVNVFSSVTNPTYFGWAGSTANAITSGTYHIQGDKQWSYFVNNAQNRIGLSTSPGGRLMLFNAGGGAGTGEQAISAMFQGPSSGVLSTTGFGYSFSATMKPTFKTAVQAVSTAGSQWLIGLFDTIPHSTTITNGVYFLSTATATTITAVTKSSSGNTTAGLGVTATGYHKLRAVVTTTQVDFYVDGTLTTSITATIPSTMNLFPGAGLVGQTASGTNNGFEIDYIVVDSTFRQ